MDAQPPSTVGSRRGVRLPPIQTANRSVTVRVKPPLPEELDSEESGNRVPLRPKPHGFAIRKWFTRSKSQPHIPGRDPALSATVASEEHGIFGHSPGVASPLHSVNATPISVKSSTHFPIPNDDDILAATKEPGALSAWDPPPFFMAYPKAVKHATLPCPILSTDEILRRKMRRDLKASNARDKAMNGDNNMDGSGPKGVVKAKTWKKGKKIHSRNQSSFSCGLKWSQKIFILATSGHLLQYGIDGSFDRLPEEVLALGADSVAFACDAIPGRHWVLQISQTQDDVEPSLEPKKTILDRFRRTSNAEPQKATSSFLLILDSAEELTSWLTFVRRAIQVLGGKDYPSETLGATQLQPSPMVSQTVKQVIRKGSVDQALSLPRSVRDDQISVPGLTRRESRKHVQQPSEISSPSSLASAMELDNLRRDSRLSCVSIGTRTMPSSQSSSSSATVKTPISKSPCRESPRAARSPARIETADLGFRSKSSTKGCGNSEDFINETPLPPPRAESRLVCTPNFSHPIVNKRNSIAMSPKTISFPVESGACQSPVLHIIPTAEMLHGSNIDEKISSDHGSPPRRRGSTSSGILDSEGAYSTAGTDSSETQELDDDIPSLTPISPLRHTHRTRRYSSSDGMQSFNRPISEYRPALSTLSDEPLDISGLSPGYNSTSNTRSRPRPQSLGPRAYSEPRIKICRSPRHPSPNSEPSQDSIVRQRSNTAKSSNSRRSSLNSLSSRKSMPQIPHGPPPAPPPTCPLPEVPSLAIPEALPQCESSRLSIGGCQWLPQKVTH
ncbi:peptidase family M20/M25/M40 protein [Nannizzia gypsea CBS 118893]|uniref:Peptidase family M20/M25/M40 protein n=1 Tax=Arthroderma gypseum (strain ATCC MYA-4604 / CBS 118893) TaxID=535722 RepID=E4UQJ3_ARTGP|nr:peptidase family M20/M25/M40 protein [Nannizzia gypsea CBS 118893]EFQ99222.1 peptidase family M20/M25/M40 protein [Nannizzia gypsea CBS 118893]